MKRREASVFIVHQDLDSRLDETDRNLAEIRKTVLPGDCGHCFADRLFLRNGRDEEHASPAACAKHLSSPGALPDTFLVVLFKRGIRNIRGKRLLPQPSFVKH